LGSKHNSAKHLDLNERYNIKTFKHHFLKHMVDRAVDEELFMNNNREMGKFLVKNLIKKSRDNSRIMTVLAEVKKAPKFNPSGLKEGDHITFSSHHGSHLMGVKTHIGKNLFLQLRRYIFIGNSLQHADKWMKPEKKLLTLLNKKRFMHYVVEHMNDKGDKKERSCLER
jgi:hypothetical protein